MSLHDPVDLPCGLQLPNRIAKAAMAENLATNKHHSPDDTHLKAYEQWADGGWGMILTGNVMVDQRFHGGPRDVQVPTVQERSAVESSWKKYAETAQKGGSPAIVQLCHPGRQSVAGSGTAGFFEKRVSASDIKLNFGSGLIARMAASLIFGAPRPLTTEEIRGPEGIIAKFVAGAVNAERAGFKGIELHAAHGYLLAQFMSPATNQRTDDYGGSAAKRVRIVVEILQAIRAAVSKQFAVGIKLNSVDASQAESSEDIIEQVRLIIDAGVDFIEVSGGTYENPRMNGPADADGAGPSPSSTTGVKESTRKREAYFLEFTNNLREHFPKAVLMVTGGFRSRTGMADAIESGACDIVGVGRPACVWPELPKDIILNKSVADADATVRIQTPPPPFWLKYIPIKIISSGWASIYYQGKIIGMGKGTFVAGQQ